MTTTDYLSRELRRARLSLHRAEKKPNTPESEMHGLRDKIACLEEALAAVQGRDLARMRLDRDAWGTCMWCVLYRQFGNKYCPSCGRPLTDAAWAELERRMQE